MPDVVIRQATAEDAEQAAGVLNAVIAEGSLTLFDTPFSPAAERAFIAALGPRSALFVAEIDGAIVGVQSIDVFASLAASTAHVATMGTWIRTEARGQGIGARLAAHSLAFALTHGYTKVVIQVLATNTRALRFYRGLGFTDIGTARAHVRLGSAFYDEVFLELMLDSVDTHSGRRS